MKREYALPDYAQVFFQTFFKGGKAMGFYPSVTSRENQVLGRAEIRIDRIAIC